LYFIGKIFNAPGLSGIISLRIFFLGGNNLILHNPVWVPSGEELDIPYHLGGWA